LRGCRTHKLTNTTNTVTITERHWDKHATCKHTQ